jgi:cellulose synthase/poly-beta-1,6-N-acetylglucosamine synthase-like glycosyltransferase
MLKWIIWGISFISLYLGVFWVHIMYRKVIFERQWKDKKPKVTLVVPALNEEKSLAKTIHSIASLNYPKDKIEAIIVDHGSKDKTSEVAKNLIKKYPHIEMKLIYKAREDGHIKAHAFNAGLEIATGEYVGCVDADTILMEDCLHEMIPMFKDEKVGAVISTIKVTRPRKFLEKIQHLEYIFGTYVRSLMSKIDTLHITPGALSVYRKALFDKYGPFDENNVTEDLEMAMRLNYHGYKIRIATGSVTYTKVPNTVKSHFDQRVRWYRGFIYNNLKYKKMMFKKKYGMIGNFQYPVNFLTIFIVLLMFILLGYEVLRSIFRGVTKLALFGTDVFIVEFPSLKDLILDMNITIIFPIAISFLIGLFIYHSAHKSLKEKWKYPFALAGYVIIYPVLRGAQWLTAVYRETFGVKKKW